MNRKVEVSVKALIIGGLCVVFAFLVALKLISIDKAIDNARLVIQVQQNTGNIQALDRGLGQAMKEIEALKAK